MGNINLRFSKFEESEAWYANEMARQKKYKLPNGECRHPTLGMEMEFRALRSIGFEQLEQSQIIAVHHYEQNHLWDRYILPWEIRSLLNKSEYRSGQCTRDQLEWMKSFCLKNKPEPRSIEFRDGMNFQQAWDLMIWNMRWELPVNAGHEKESQIDRLKEKSRKDLD